jgi:hypothetical protein
MMELEDLKSLIELLKETDITELQIEKEGTKVGKECSPPLIYLPRR